MCIRAIDTARTIRAWDRLARHYDRFMAPLERFVFRRWRKRAIRELGARGDLLEVGTGTGLNFDHYPADARGVASDSSYGMLARASRRKRPAGIRLVVADAERLPFRDETFDAVLATLVFCNVPDDAQGFREVRRVLRDDARFVALEHVRPNGAPGWLFDRLNRLTVSAFGDHINRTPAETMRHAHLIVERVESGAASLLQLITARRKSRNGHQERRSWAE